LRRARILILAACTAQPIKSEVELLPTIVTVDLPSEDDQLPTDIPSSQSIVLTVVYTNDEHGWMQGQEPGSGAANLAGLWSEAGYVDDGALIILSGGDNWTGPAISTWFDGQSMVAVMNAMGYDAAAIGNHEFDFGLDGLQARLSEADFPYLSANIRYKADGTTPTDLGIQAYRVIDVEDLRIGLIGLTLTSTPKVTNPVNVADFEFIDYEIALREIVPKVNAEGVDLILVPAHICTYELIPLARAVADLGIALLGGGHCNERYAEEIGETVVISGGDGFSSYAYATFELDSATKDLLYVDYGVIENQGGPENQAVAEIVARWQVETDSELNVVIGYLDADVLMRSSMMAALITESWLYAYPTADVAITNWGGMRDRIPAGEITMAAIVSMMPFNNVLVELKMTGAQLQRVLLAGHGDPPVGGIHLQSGQWILNDSGLPIESDGIYSVLVNDFMYAGGDDLTMLAEFDPNAYNTSINWRQPVIDWIEAGASTVDDPLDAAIDALIK
jgi:2',3'-cyclic-nucleotide 2'-phosphodiesterase (5'-nucleotidase family)